MRYKYIASHRYDSQSGKVARGIKYGDVESILKAAEEMSAFVPDDAVLVPMPSHHGFATQTYKLALAISQHTGTPVADVIRGKLRHTLYETKKNGAKPHFHDLQMYLTSSIPSGRYVVVIDNCIDTGASAMAAASLFKKCTVLAYAMTHKIFS
jgi:adenine/guanine phosphoribosyltransferase-like PRPP-binding protein